MVPVHVSGDMCVVNHSCYPRETSNHLKAVLDLIHCIPGVWKLHVMAHSLELGIQH